MGATAPSRELAATVLTSGTSTARTSTPPVSTTSDQSLSPCPASTNRFVKSGQCRSSQTDHVKFLQTVSSFMNNFIGRLTRKVRHYLW